MTTYRGNGVNGTQNIATPAYAGLVAANTFSMAVPLDAKTGDILEIGILPQNNTICDCTVFSDAVGISFDAGIMTGTPGDTVEIRECGNELFTACDIGTSGGAIKPEKASAYRIASSNVERSIGLKITGGSPAAGTVSITLFIKS